MTEFQGLVFSGRHHVPPVPVDSSEGGVLPPLFPEGVSFVAPRTAVSVDEAAVGIGCLREGERREGPGGRGWD